MSLFEASEAANRQTAQPLAARMRPRTPDVEEGIVTLVGATTQNPFFAINSALVSRSRIFEFKPLSTDDIKSLIRRSLADRERGLGRYDVRMHDDAIEFLADVSDGDARR